MTDDTPGDGPEAASPERVEEVAAEFEAQGRPYARATVVRREPPVSANVGDRALVTAEGDVVGWVGGAECAQSVVVDRAKQTLADGEPVLVGLAPDPDEVDRPGVEAYPMTCHSGGTLEVFVEPITPVPRLVVVGESPIADALVRLAGELSVGITVVSEETAAADVPIGDETVAASDAEAVAAAIEGAEYVVVASMGEYDHLGVAAGLLAGASYVGLVASDERRRELAASVGDRLGLDADTVSEAVTTPAGLDIGARTPEEIAVSIIAELVARRRGAEGPIAFEVADATDAANAADAAEEGTDSGHSHDHGADDVDSEAETAVDPVCGMDVVVEEAAATAEAGGKTYHFCGQGCADAFTDDPDRYVDTEVATNG